MPAVQRNNLTFTIEDGLLVAREGDAVLDKVDASRAELAFERWNIIVPALLANANFSEKEWSSMLGVVPEIAAAEEAPVVAEGETAAAPVKRGRKASS